MNKDNTIQHEKAVFIAIGIMTIIGFIHNGIDGAIEFGMTTLGIIMFYFLIIIGISKH